MTKVSHRIALKASGVPRFKPEKSFLRSDSTTNFKWARKKTSSNEQYVSLVFPLVDTPDRNSTNVAMATKRRRDQ